MKKRLAIFVHFNPEPCIKKSTLHYLKALKTIAQDIVLVSNSPLLESERNKIYPYAEVLERDNLGYDFMAWRDGLRYKNYETIKNYDEVILANDGCYAPLFPFLEMLDSMELATCDFWSSVDSYEIDYHLQSFFVVYRNQILKSSPFKEFFESIEEKPSKLEVVLHYEIGGTKWFKRKGFVPKAYQSNSFFQRLIFGIAIRFSKIFYPPNTQKNLWKNRLWAFKELLIRPRHTTQVIINGNSSFKKGFRF